MEGYLKKWINLIYRWQNRYFIIHDGVLMYCVGKDKPKKGQVHLSICSIRTVASDPVRIVINYGMNEMHLRASSVYEQQKWLTALIEEQEKVQNGNKRQSLLSDDIDNFAMLDQAPVVNLSRIHTTLTKLWVAQAQLEESLSMMKSHDSQKLCSITQDIKQIATEMGQQVDDEYKKLVDISRKLQNKIRETNDNNPPDADEAEEELLDNHNTMFQSFQSFDDSEFHSVLEEFVHDERKQELPLQNRRASQKASFIRQSSFIPLDSKSILDLLERIKNKQPIKYVPTLLIYDRTT